MSQRIRPTAGHGGISRYVKRQKTGSEVAPTVAGKHLRADSLRRSTRSEGEGEITGCEPVFFVLQYY